MTVRLIAALIAPLLITQASFEGKIRLRTIEVELEGAGLKESWLDVAPNTLAAREDAKVEDASMQIRNNVLRFENKDGSPGYALMDMTRNVMVMVMQAERMYMEMPMGPPGPPAPANRTPQGTSLVKPLGQTRTINGVTVKGYEIRSPDQIIRAWMTQDFPGLTWAFRNAGARNEANSGDQEDASRAQLARYGFPMLMITLTDRSLSIEETVSIERGALGADLFKVPAGFTKQSIPGGP